MTENTRLSKIMYHDPYNSIINTKLKRDIEAISEKIKKEDDKYKIAKLEEQKLIQGMFSNELGYSYGKYRSPW